MKKDKTEARDMMVPREDCLHPNDPNEFIGSVITQLLEYLTWTCDLDHKYNYIEIK